MEDYNIRKATIKDASFIADVIIAAEKTVTSKLSLSTLCDLPESKVKELIISMLEEEIDGCEFSLSSYLITEHKGQPVAGLSGWVERGHDDESSTILKSNLLTYTLPKENTKTLISNSNLISGLFIDREKMALQFEYAFVMPEHRGKNLIKCMQDVLLANAVNTYQNIKKIQIQCFGNSVYAINLLTRLGFDQVKKVVIDNKEILNYLPDNTKVLLEKNLN